MTLRNNFVWFLFRLKLNDVKGPAYVKAINDLVERYPELQMLFIILPMNKPEPYGAVKKRLAVDFGSKFIF